MKQLSVMNFEIKIKKILFSFLLMCTYLWAMAFLSPVNCAAQSTSQSYPTAVSSNELIGKIKARDIGDARLTTYYYFFNGGQGDIFINVVTRNLDGDIDIFTASGLKPLTKIKVYSDASDNETGRVVYLRQPERLILRIEGRTPNDEEAIFRIKFAGSFLPVTNMAETEEPKLPEVKTDTQNDIQVNSVGTIVAVKPKPTPSPKETKTKTGNTDEIIADSKKEDRKNEKPVNDEAEAKQETKDEKELAGKNTDENKDQTKTADEKKEEKNSTPVVVITDNLPKKTETENSEAKTETNTSKNNKTTSKTNKTPPKKTTEPNPLESINLVVLFKDGTKIERPMSEVLRVSVDKGVLTIISKDGGVGRYSILEVTEMTIK